MAFKNKGTLICAVVDIKDDIFYEERQNTNGLNGFVFYIHINWFHAHAKTYSDDYLTAQQIYQLPMIFGISMQ